MSSVKVEVDPFVTVAQFIVSKVMKYVSFYMVINDKMITVPNTTFSFSKNPPGILVYGDLDLEEDGTISRIIINIYDENNNIVASEDVKFSATINKGKYRVLVAVYTSPQDVIIKPPDCELVLPKQPIRVFDPVTGALLLYVGSDRAYAFEAMYTNVDTVAGQIMIAGREFQMPFGEMYKYFAGQLGKIVVRKPSLFEPMRYLGGIFVSDTTNMPMAGGTPYFINVGDGVVGIGSVYPEANNFVQTRSVLYPGVYNLNTVLNYDGEDRISFRVGDCTYAIKVFNPYTYDRWATAGINLYIYVSGREFIWKTNAIALTPDPPIVRSEGLEFKIYPTTYPITRDPIHWFVKIPDGIYRVEGQPDCCGWNYGNKTFFGCGKLFVNTCNKIMECLDEWKNVMNECIKNNLTCEVNAIFTYAYTGGISALFNYALANIDNVDDVSITYRMIVPLYLPFDAVLHFLFLGDLTVYLYQFPIDVPVDSLLSYDPRFFGPTKIAYRASMHQKTGCYRDLCYRMVGTLDIYVPKPENNVLVLEIEYTPYEWSEQDIADFIDTYGVFGFYDVDRIYKKTAKYGLKCLRDVNIKFHKYVFPVYDIILGMVVERRLQDGIEFFFPTIYGSTYLRTYYDREPLYIPGPTLVEITGAFKMNILYNELIIDNLYHDHLLGAMMGGAPSLRYISYKSGNVPYILQNEKYRFLLEG